MPKYALLGACKRLMPKLNSHVAAFLDHHRLPQLHLAHGLEDGVEALPNIFVRCVGEFVHKTNDCWIPRKAFVKDICWRYMSREAARTTDFNTVIKNHDMYVICNRIIPMQDGIGNRLV